MNPAMPATTRHPNLMRFERFLWALPLALSGMAGAHLGAKLALGEGATQLIFRALIAVVGLEVLSFLWRLGLPQNLMGALA